MARRRSRGGRGARVALAAPGREAGGREWYPRHDPAREVTAAGTAQTRAVREAELLIGAGEEETRREIAVMRGIGAVKAARRVLAAVRGLDTALMYHGSLDEAAKAAAEGCARDDPDRPWKIVAGQWELVRGAGFGAIATARRVVACTRAFNALMAEQANAASEYRRDGSAAEAAAAAAARKFVRRGDSQYGFTGVTVDPNLAQHAENEVKMEIRRHAVLSSVYPVEYYVFRARLSGDREEIDSPKVARNAHECEVRLPDGALVDPSGIRVVARMGMIGPEALGHLDRLRGLGVGVVIDEGL